MEGVYRGSGSGVGEFCLALSSSLDPYDMFSNETVLEIEFKLSYKLSYRDLSYLELEALLPSGCFGQSASACSFHVQCMSFAGLGL